MSAEKLRAMGFGSILQGASLNKFWLGEGSHGMVTVCDLFVDHRRQRIQQSWDARLLRRLSQNTPAAKEGLIKAL